MSKSRVQSGSVVLEYLADESSVAATKLLADLCRTEPELRDWLWTEFAQDSEVRDRLALLIDTPSLQVDGIDGFAHLNGEGRAWRVEQHRLRTSNGQEQAIFGGLTWRKMEQVFRQYEAGALDLGTFMLAHDWEEANQSGKIPPELMRASVAFLRSAVCGDRRLLNHFHRALDLVECFDSSDERRITIGYTEWWKLQVLRYMLRHPRPAYQTRDVRAHLASLGLDVSSLDIRRFCNRHGIRRDTRPGRPRTNAAETGRGKSRSGEVHMKD